MSRHPTDPSQDFPGASDPGRPKSRPFPRVKLILNSVSVNDLMHVVRTVMDLTRLCKDEATHKMWEAFHFGRSQLLVTHRERAEFLAEQFAGRGLTVLIEPE